MKNESDPSEQQWGDGGWKNGLKKFIGWVVVIGICLLLTKISLWFLLPIMIVGTILFPNEGPKDRRHSQQGRYIKIDRRRR
jgi:hypothetical protein